MKQILQNLKTGQLEVTELPFPEVGRGQLLIQTRTSLISAGTERMLVEFSQASMIQKAHQQPEKVKQVLDKIKTDGLIQTVETVYRKLDELLPMGYSNVGIVLDVGSGVHGFKPGDRVVSNGPHAEVVCVPRNLCAKIPDEVSDDEAAFTVLSSIALAGVRLTKPTLGEKFLVFGMGMIGLLILQCLKASGCRVMAVDLNPKRLALAERFGAETLNVGEGNDPIMAAQAWTDGRGVDGVLLAADAPKNNEIIHQAAEVCRKRGRIILVGKVGLQLRHSDFFKKEITLQLSASYGPGRYDNTYEQKGQDYPFAFVRWTEQRNFEAILELMKSGSIQVKDLITDRFPLTDAVAAYERISSTSDSLAVMLQYSGNVNRSTRITVTQQSSVSSDRVNVGIIGAGNFAKAILLPALVKTSANLVSIASLSGVTGQHAARKFGIRESVTNYKLILEDPKIDTVFILVGHHLHGSMVCEALEAGKHVFVEKPLCLTPSELELIARAVDRVPGSQLMVGFNRRFSPHTIRIKDLLMDRGEPLCMNMTINAGANLSNSWYQDPELGGSRIIGEGCHFIDLLSFLTDSRVVSVYSAMVGEGPAVLDDKMSIVLTFADGSVGTVNYFANGPKSYPKEMLEVFSDGRALCLENFRVTRGYGFNGFNKFKTIRQDKGHNTEMELFVDQTKEGGEPLMPFEQVRNVTETTFAAMKSAAEEGSIQM